MKHEILEIQSPLGGLYVKIQDGYLVELGFGLPRARRNQVPMAMISTADSALYQKVKKQLHEYFLGQRKEFDLPLRPAGTEFQRQAWKVLQKISYGEVISYSEQALRMHNQKAIRAVGSANGRNPIPIIIPCHRVCRLGGGLGGYSAGLSRKRFLLELEARYL